MLKYVRRLLNNQAIYIEETLIISVCCYFFQWEWGAYGGLYYDILQTSGSQNTKVSVIFPSGRFSEGGESSCPFQAQL